MEQALVSVILPVYNKIKYLPTTLPSLLSQTYRDFELIAVDDGSTDGSGDFLDRLAKTDSRVKVIHQPNAGVSAARNAALDRASGDYVVFADADDTVCPDWLEVLAKEAETSGADIVVSGFFSTDSNGKALDTVLPPEEGNITGKEFLGNFYAHQSNHGLPGFGHGKIVRRDLIEKNNIRFTLGLKLAEDLDFFVRLYDKAETVRTVRYAGYNYLQGAENSTGGSSAYRVDYLSQVKIWLGIVSILTAHGEYCGENRAFADEKLGGYISCAMLYRSDVNRTSASEMRRLCGDFRAAGNGALRPAAWLYNIRLGGLCRLYAWLYRKFGGAK
ncbi:MAG: glycosyltransferase family 2 protein [Eubacteriales bacterium]|nr:glycosyltransferase family 2 protein [Eubacteriales bacterium]